MFVIKRSGQKVPTRYDSITDRNIELSKDLDIDVAYLSKMVIQSLKNGMTTTEIDELAAETAAYMSSYEPDYDVLAARITVSNHQKSTSSSFFETMKQIYEHINKDTGRKSNVINEHFMKFIETHKETIDNSIDYSKDFNYSYFGFKTLLRLYLIKVDKKIIERPQHMLMRVACAIHSNTNGGGDITRAIQCYKDMAEGYYTHASPTLFNSGASKQQMSSCFLLDTDDDLKHIYETNLKCALISKHGGGIGVNITKVRAKGSPIHSTNGISDGIVPMIQVFNSTGRYCNQCITPDIVVYSKAGFKRMDEITTEDFLITNDGTFKKVNEVIINKKLEDIYNIRTYASFDTLKCTKEHDILVIKDETGDGHDDLKRRLDTNKRQIEFIPASELKEKYYMGYPIPTFQEDFEISKEQCRLYGILLGDGCIVKRINDSSRYQVTLNYNKKQETLNFVKHFLESNNIHYWISNDCDLCWTYNDKSIEKIKITYDMLYDKNHCKHIIPSFVHLPLEKIAMILKGLLETDGSVTSTGIFLYSTDKNLIYSCRYMLLRFGILTSTQITDRVGQILGYNKKGRAIISNKKSYSLRLPKVQKLIENNIFSNFEPKNKVNFFEYNNILFTRIKSISKTYYEGNVYDFNMIDNHNYLTDAGLVHNSGKRKGSIAMYLEPWHPDVVEFLALRYNQPPEELRARDIFLALWVNDIFMKRVEEDGMWSLFCPSVVPMLAETYGEEFEKIYIQAEQDKKYMKQMKARDLFEKITHAQIETGLPYILYKDSVNKKNMQENIGIIRSSNLCAEILEVTNGSSTAVCNLASISLPKYIRYIDGKPIFDYEKLYQITKTIVRNIDNIIDINYYPIEEAKKNNTDYRPMGIGIQGLADVFAMFKAPWGCVDADTLNRNIFEIIYYAAVEASHELALERGSYSAFEGSPYSKGILQYHLWNETPTTFNWNWKALEEKVKRGMRNSLLIALMPTASSSQILGNNECFEAFTSNLYSRSTLAGDFIILNKHLARDLKQLNLWNKDIVNKIIENDGSVQGIEEIPDDLKEVYKTVWEIKQSVIVKYAAMRAPFVDQTQSMNIFFEHPTNRLLSSLHMMGWKAGLKTGNYYIRSKPSRNAVKFTILKEKEKKGKEYVKDGKKMICTEDICVACSS